MDLLEQFEAALDARYRIERELGRGGMAIVFLAQDLKHHRRVAIKVLKPELSVMLGGERFLREIEIAATLQHPHILPLYDSGQAGGLLFYVMPFVEGESLRQLLARERQLPFDTALRIARDVGSALAYAHEHGVIHRDIKPENIMLSGGHAVVADFGIARALHAGGTEQLTATGMVLGTPQYMSPEQATGAAVDGRTDQYSLACILYEMLSGQPPYTGPSFQAVIARHSLDPVPGLRLIRESVPPSVAQAVAKAMAKLPADRFTSMQQFMGGLGSAEALTAPAVTPAGSRQAFTSRVGARVVGVLVACALLTAAWWIVTGRRTVQSHIGRGAVGSIAVLPFQELRAPPDGSYLAEGMTEGLIADLAQIRSLKVISHASGAKNEGTQYSLPELASRLGAEAIVKGSIGRMGDSVDVSVRLLRARDSTVLFSASYRDRLGELPDLQRRITLGVTHSIKAELGSAEQNRLGARREVDQRAYEAYLRGRFSLERGELEPARLQFEQASRVAPDWAPPYVGLANYYTSLPFFSDVPPADVLPKARGALAHALELDPDLAEAHAANAYIRAYYEWDWRAAEQEFRRALELRPNDADAYFSYSRFLASRRRLDEAIAQLARAVELDPLSRPLQANRALLDYFAGRYDRAGSRLRELLTSDSSDATVKWGLALVAEQQGKAGEAVSLLEPIAAGNLNRKSSLGHAYAVAGNVAKARGVLAELRQTSAKSYVPSYFFAVVYVGLRQRDEALRYLERAYEERSTVLAYLLIDPRLAPVRTDPRFLELARRLGGN